MMLGFTSISGVVHAGYSGGPVENLRAHQPNVVMFKAGYIQSSPSCGRYDEWAVAIDTPGGKAIYTLLLLAYAHGRMVTVSGTHACEAWPDRESPGNVVIQNN
jgi:hypothetical protein